MESNYLVRLGVLRQNIATLLRYGNVVPFNWNTKGFRCFYCSKQMKDCDTLKDHTNKHTYVDIDRFVNEHVITKDVPVKIDIANISCRICKELPIKSLENLISHIAGVHGGYDVTKPECFFPFVLNNDVMQCLLCENTYDNFTAMIGHMYREHTSHSFVCQICGISFKDQIRLNRHLTARHEGHKCTLCGTILATFRKLQLHKARLHGRTKDYACGLCSQNFKSNYQVKVHMGKVHNVEKYKIKCDHCPKICNTKGAMSIHLQSLHPDVKYQCDMCDYTSGRKWSIKLHQRKHLGIKEYACSICERRFGRSSNLRTHMKVHTGNFGRVCRFCRRGFVDQQTLNDHEAEIHNDNN